MRSSGSLLLSCAVHCGAPTTVSHLLLLLPAVHCRRAPDSARVKAKMMYASTKDFFK